MEGPTAWICHKTRHKSHAISPVSLLFTLMISVCLDVHLSRHTVLSWYSTTHQLVPLAWKSWFPTPKKFTYTLVEAPTLLAMPFMQGNHTKACHLPHLQGLCQASNLHSQWLFASIIYPPGRSCASDSSMRDSRSRFPLEKIPGRHGSSGRQSLPCQCCFLTASQPLSHPTPPFKNQRSQKFRLHV